MNRLYRLLVDYLKSWFSRAIPGRKIAKSREVQRHLDEALTAAQRGQWRQADTDLNAAVVAARCYRDLRTQVQNASDRIHQSVAEYYGRQCADAIEAVRLKQFVRARQRLADVDAPPNFHVMIQHLDSLTDLLERLDQFNGPGEEQFQQLVEQSWQALDAALGVAAYPVPGVLSQVVADWQLEELIAPLLEVISSQRLPIEERTQFAQALSRMGASAFAAVVRRLAETPTDNEAGHWLLDLLADLSPGKQASVLVACFARLGTGPRANLATWMARAFGSLNDMLFELLAGVLNRLPPDRRFAAAVQTEIGADRLRQAALQWAARGHKAARVVYERM